MEVYEWNKEAPRYLIDIATSYNIPPVNDISGHLMTIYNIARLVPGNTIVELGVGGGNSTIALLASNKTVHSFDIDECLFVNKMIGELGIAVRWHFTKSDSINVAWDKPIDLLFIDTSHTFNQTTHELELFGKHMVFGGAILLHDIASNEGASRAVHEYLGRNPYIFRYEAHYWCYGLGILWRDIE